MNPPCNCQPSAAKTQQTWTSTSMPKQLKLGGIQQALNEIDGVQDWSAVATNPSTVAYDSYYERCICWHEQGDPIRFWERGRRIYTWRAFYGWIQPPQPR